MRETLVSQNSVITEILAWSFCLSVIDVYGDIAVIWYFIIKDTNIFAIRDLNASKGVNAKQSKKIQLCSFWTAAMLTNKVFLTEMV